MCDACRGLALGELTFLTDRQWDAVKKVMCSDDDQENGDHENCAGVEATTEWAETTYALVKKQHEKIGTLVDTLIKALSERELPADARQAIYDLEEAVGELPGELADAE